MEVQIKVTGDDGKVLLKTKCKSIDRAVDELNVLERSVEKKKKETEFFLKEFPDNCPMCDEEVKAKWFDYDGEAFAWMFECECGAKLIVEDDRESLDYYEPIEDLDRSEMARMNFNY